MEGYLKIFSKEYGTAEYKAEIPGLIQLDKISDSLTILKIYFQDLITISEEEYTWPEHGAEVMLANYAVEISTLDELDGKTIVLKEGFTPDILFAMLSVWDGQSLNNNKIMFTKIAEGCFRVFWTGYFGDGKQEDDVELEMIAYQTNDLVTPLCDHTEELIEYYTNRI
ncbi:hypothetical protein ACLI1A_13725 [Flavobacterium sp. RHBU_3]|uniref:hypothetical protein n=1 Tax=Flavobacterium sp. RHBU_3 TaxID=3391184 RepID=UPI0039848781